MSTLIAPKLVSSREQARELTAGLGDDCSGSVVMVDCSALQASTLVRRRAGQGGARRPSR